MGKNEKIDFVPIKCQVFFSDVLQQIRCSNIFIKKNVFAMSRSNLNCQAVSIILKIMFYRDTYALAIYTSRGACARGDIYESPTHLACRVTSLFSFV